TAQAARLRQPRPRSRLDRRRADRAARPAAHEGGPRGAGGARRHAAARSDPRARRGRRSGDGTARRGEGRARRGGRAARDEPDSARAPRRRAPLVRADARRVLPGQGDRRRLLARRRRARPPDRRLVPPLHRRAQGRNHGAPDPLQPSLPGAADVHGDQGARAGDRPAALPVDAGEALAGIRGARALEGARLGGTGPYRPRLARPLRARAGGRARSVSRARRRALPRLAAPAGERRAHLHARAARLARADPRPRRRLARDLAGRLRLHALRRAGRDRQGLRAVRRRADPAARRAQRGAGRMTCPPSWAITKLGDICEVVSGSTPSTAVPEYWGGEIAWITPDDLSRHAGKLIARGARNITQAGYDSCSTRIVPQGTVLFTSRAPIGYVAIAAQSVCTNQGFKSFIPSGAVTSDYLYWFLRYATPAIRELGSGTTFPELSKARAKEIQVPVAPSAEQRRIVAAIEEHFSRLDAAEVLLESAHRRLRVLRRLLFRTAFAGVDARVALAEVAEIVSGQTPKGMNPLPDGPVPFFKVGDMNAASG